MHARWRWELTPLELFEGLRPIKAMIDGTDQQLAVEPFATPGRMLQLAVSHSNPAPFVQRLLAETPEIPDSGDSRSGVLAFSGDVVVGSFLLNDNGSHIMRVAADHRRNNLGFDMTMAWYKATKRIPLPPQSVTPLGAKTLLSVHRSLVAWALENGREVPERVWCAVAAGTEAQQILSRMR